MSKDTTKQDAKAQPMDASIRENVTGKAAVNNRRECYALRALTAEVFALFPETSAEYSRYNGRSAALEVIFTVHESPGLAELLELAESDARVESVLVDDREGLASVVFWNHPRLYDLRDSFGLDEAWSVFIEEIGDASPETTALIARLDDELEEDQSW